MSVNNGFSIQGEAVISQMSYKDIIEKNITTFLLSTAEKITNLIGQSDNYQIGIAEHIINKVKGENIKELLSSLNMVYILISEYKLFTISEYKYIFVQTLLKKCKQINSENFEEVKGIFKGFEKEFDRAKFFVNS